MAALTAEVISIGDEMTSGARLDTNAQWLSRRLGELGIEVTFHSTVGDSLSNNIDVFRIASQRVDIVVCTGGLGPTRDDLTREVLAELVNEPLELRESSLQHIRELFSRRQREMPARNENQAMFPPSAQEIFNPQGTAPGVDLIIPSQTDHSARFFALPGVPAEMKAMFDETVAPRILKQAGTANVIRHQVMRLFGIGESDMEQLLGDMIARDREPRVGITVTSATISLRITAMADSEQICEDQIDSTRTEILQKAGEYYFGEGDHYEQYHAIEKLLSAREESLLVIELGSAAPLGDWFSSLENSSIFCGGMSFTNLDDLRLLTNLPNGDESCEFLMKRFGATWLLIIDRYPSLEAEIKTSLPNAQVDLITIHKNGQRDKKSVNLGGHPAILHSRIAKAGLQWLRSCIASIE